MARSLCINKKHLLLGMRENPPADTAWELKKHVLVQPSAAATSFECSQQLTFSLRLGHPHVTKKVERWIGAATELRPNEKTDLTQFCDF